MATINLRTDDPRISARREGARWCFLTEASDLTPEFRSAPLNVNLKINLISHKTGQSTVFMNPTEDFTDDHEIAAWNLYNLDNPDWKFIILND